VKNLFVGNLGSEVTLEELRRLFEAYGQVVQVHIIVGSQHRAAARVCIRGER